LAPEGGAKVKGAHLSSGRALIIISRAPIIYLPSLIAGHFG
jgi:hypothetical protein